MSRFWDYDNDVMSILRNVVETLILGLLWMICSVPVITIGASSAAFYYAYHKSVRMGKGYAWKEFFRGFKSNFKGATKLWLILAAIGVIIGLDYWLLLSMVEALQIAKVLQALLFVVSVFWVMSVLWAFSYLARFEIKTKALLKNLLILILANFPRVVLVLLIFAGACLAALKIPFVGLAMPAIYIYFANRIMEKVFRKYMSKEDLEKEMI